MLFAGSLSLLSLVLSVSADAGSWPTHRSDPARSGVTTEQLQFPLKPMWVYESKYPPQPAWSGPARRDGWHKTENLKPRMVFDWAYHVTADENSVFSQTGAYLMRVRPFCSLANHALKPL